MNNEKKIVIQVLWDVQTVSEKMSIPRKIYFDKLTTKHFFADAIQFIKKNKNKIFRMIYEKEGWKKRKKKSPVRFPGKNWKRPIRRELSSIFPQEWSCSWFNPLPECFIVPSDRSPLDSVRFSIAFYPWVCPNTSSNTNLSVVHFPKPQVFKNNLVPMSVTDVRY